MVPGTARKLHLWRHLEDPSSNGGGQLTPLLVIVSWEWDVMLRQDNVKVCHLNHSELSWRPWTARQLHLSIHMKDPFSIGGRQLTRQLVIAPENKMSCQGKETSRYVIWTIQSCYTIEQPLNCILGYVWRIRHLLGIDSVCTSCQL